MVRDEFNFGAIAHVKVGINGVIAVQKIKIMSMAESFGQCGNWEYTGCTFLNGNYV